MEQRIKVALFYIGGTLFCLFGVYLPTVGRGLVPLVDRGELLPFEADFDVVLYIGMLALTAGLGAIIVAFTEKCPMR